MSILGNSVLRVEDDGLLTGSRPFTADLITGGTLHARFIRSSVAHGNLVSVSGGPSLYTAASLELPKLVPWPPTPDRYARDLLAVDKVRYVGDPIAVVTGTSMAEAEDLAGDVYAEIEPLPPVASPLESDEVAFEVEPMVDPSVLDEADVVVEATFLNQKLAPVPLETNSILVVPDEDGEGLCLWVSTQFPWDNQAAVAAALELDTDRVRVIAPAVGGGFGAKGHTYPEHIVVAAIAHLTGKPVAWQETRSENLLNMTHGRAQVQHVALGAKRDGTITGLRVEVVADAGAYPHVGAWLPNYTRLMCTGTYRIPRVAFSARSMVTNTAPVGAYRGAGRPEATAFLERSIDLLARRLDIDPVEIRRRNLLDSHNTNHVTPSGAVYDSGDYRGTLDLVVQASGYETLRREQSMRRARGDRWLLGIGVSTYIEVTGNGPTQEFASVTIETDGSATVLSGVSSHGQGHQTTYAQIAGAQLGLPVDKIRVIQSDTAVVPRGNGTYGSRSLQLAGSAVDKAAEAVVERASQVAAERLEANPADMVVYDGVGVGIIGSPATAISWAELAPLAVELDLDQGARTYPSGAHVSVVEVDRETGAVRLIRHITVDDCGNVVNPMLAQGQQHGGIAQGVAQALWEEMVYTTDGQPVTSTLLDYLAPTAQELPTYEINSMVTPTPLNRLGVKGIGEATTIGSTPAVHNAVLDALAPMGVEHLDMPLSPEKIWRAING
ncbi:xanthine dehydrogenase family protein molybdopterin-binding subunit [Candidatus Poriferisocius sp.]|uniref:xanthine dehydrogenase family protein molybdopterin-binding subunit n=1 Tax=Candidatus Poriferisocius sp. TaxID=3101276 RepID=UPI003B0132C7